MYSDIFTPDCDDYETLTTTLELTHFQRLVVLSTHFRMHTGIFQESGVTCARLKVSVAPARFVHSRYRRARRASREIRNREFGPRENSVNAQTCNASC